MSKIVLIPNLHSIKHNYIVEVPIIVHAVYNSQTEYFHNLLENLISELNKEREVIRYNSTDIDSSDCFHDMDTETNVVLNLVNYFPETFNYDSEMSITDNYNVNSLEIILDSINLDADEPLIVNIDINDAFYLSLNDRFQIDKLEIFMSSKINASVLLRNHPYKNWITLDSGFIDKLKLDSVFDNFDKDFYFNNIIKIKPVSINTFLEKIIHVIIENGSLVKNNVYSLTSNMDETMYTYYRGKHQNMRASEYIDFIEGNLYFDKYVNRFSKLCKSKI